MSSQVNQWAVEVVHLGVQRVETSFELLHICVLLLPIWRFLGFSSFLLNSFCPLDHVSEDIVADEHHASVVDLANDLLLVSVSDAIFAIVGVLEVRLREWVILRSREGRDLLVSFDKAHDLLISIHIDMAIVFVVVVEDFVEDLEDPSADVRVESRSGVRNWSRLVHDLRLQHRAPVLFNAPF